MTFSDTLDEQRRLALLCLLEASAAYSANQHLLASALDGLGHRISADRLMADLARLAEQGLAGLESLAGVGVATLTQRGLDVATGRARCPGVARPRPGM